jgi:FMN-dependent NADH-azoreductase
VLPVSNLLWCYRSVALDVVLPVSTTRINRRHVLSVAELAFERKRKALRERASSPIAGAHLEAEPYAIFAARAASGARENIQMTNILVVTSNSPRDGFSRRLANRALDALRARFPDGVATLRDLAQSPLPRANEFFADDPVLGGRKRGLNGGPTLAQSDELIDELLAADVLVIAVPMIDFAIPASLKAWVDHVTRRGRTFHYADGLPKGLVTGKKAVIARPKSHGLAGSRPGPDYQAPYLRQMLAFLGMTDIEVIDVETRPVGPERDDATSRDGIVWARDADGASTVPSAQGTATGSINDVTPSRQFGAERRGTERRSPSPSPQWTPLGAPAAKATRLKSPWR